MFLLIRQRLSATTVTEKGILLENARSGRNQGRKSYGDNGRSNAPTNESSSQALMAQDGLGGYDWSNDFEVEPANYALMAISYSSSSSSFDNGGNFLTPRADISFAGLDEYAIRNKIIESQTTELNTKTSETAGQTNDANTKKPKSANDEEEVNEVQTVRPETQTVKTRDDKSGQNSQKQGISFRKVKACFVCKSTEHLIKDCNFHDKKSQEPKLKNVVNTGQREGKPVWDNTKRVNHQNFSKYPHLSKTFVPSGVLTRTGTSRWQPKILLHIMPHGGEWLHYAYDWQQTYLQTMNFNGGFETFKKWSPKEIPGKFGWELMKVICLDTLHLVKPLEYTTKDQKGRREFAHQLSLKINKCDRKTGPNWMFDLDFLTNSMNYIPISVKIRTRIPIEDVAPAVHEKPSEDNDVQDSVDVIDKEGQHQMLEDEQVLHDELEKMKAAQATSTNKLSTDRPSVSTDRPSVSTVMPFVNTDRSSVSTANTPYVSAASTSTVQNAW
ncbi:hypothetical protein Tco_0976135 [Tanacetum coccineum]|uniref:Uncharacterized protein n=1 Tax=Tanacetum coccineum TaxID=301880 RepID=A0ABQ5EGD8_9ASTR